MRIKCNYLKCNKTAHWLVEASYSLVCLCTTHIGIKYLSMAAKIKSMHKSAKSKTEVSDIPTQ